jgi:hypothetical protein
MATTSQDSQVRSAIDTAVYLASLASDRREIDPIIQPMRAITARLQSGVKATPDEVVTLYHICDQLEDYLVKRDRMRSFTRPSLKQRVAERFDPQVRRRYVELRWEMALVLALVASFIGLVLVALPLSPDQQQQVIPAVFLLGISFAGAWFYLSGLKGLRSELRPPFILISLGLVSISLAQSQLPLAVLLSASSNSDWFAYGMYGSLYMPASWICYLGARQFGKMLGLKSRWLSLRYVAGVAITVAVVLFALPLPSFPAWSHHFVTVALALMGLACTLASYIAYQSGSVLTSGYGRALRQYGFSMAALAFGSFLYAEWSALNGMPPVLGVTPTMAIVLSLVPFLVGMITQFISGYTFKKATYL